MVLSNHYCRFMDMISRSGIRQRAGAARQLLARDSNVEQRNYSLFVAFRLLEGKWNSEETQRWSFIDIKQLGNQSFSEEIDSALRQNIEKRFAEALEDTPASFEELQKEAGEFQKKFMERRGKEHEKMDAEDHRQWFYQYAPYLTLHLRKSRDKSVMDDAVEEARRRLEWFEEFFQDGKDKDIRDHIHWMGWCRIVDWRSEGD